MSAVEELDAIHERFSADPNDAAQRLVDLARGASSEGGERAAEVYAALVARIGVHADPRFDAHHALFAGALMEGGLPARPLAEALAPAARRALLTAARFAALAQDVPLTTDPDAPGMPYGPSGKIPDADMRRLVGEDQEAFQALVSLDVWYRPIVAAWTRERTWLRAAQDDAELRAAAAAVSHGNEGGYWLSLLLNSTDRTRFVIDVPEVQTAYALTADGVVDCGQLTVLLSHALREPLARIGASGPADAGVLAVMTGEGPQKGAGAYPSTFHLYPWRALNPDSGLPEDGRHTWTAPGGSGTHSLPADFQPAAIEPVGDARVLLLVGPQAHSTVGFTRQIGATRMFGSLRASVDGVTPLEPAAREALLAAIGRA